MNAATMDLDYVTMEDFIFVKFKMEKFTGLETTANNSLGQSLKPEDLVGFENEGHLQEAVNQEYEEESISYLEDHSDEEEEIEVKKLFKQKRFRFAEKKPSVNIDSLGVGAHLCKEDESLDKLSKFVKYNRQKKIYCNPNEHHNDSNEGFNAVQNPIIERLLPEIDDSFGVTLSRVHGRMGGRIFDQRHHFSNFCTCFPNLLALDISCAFYLPSLQGIKHIRNLQKLSMSYVDFDDINGYKELSDLKHLKYLDVSGTEVLFYENDTNSIRNLLAAGVRMEALEFVDCSWTSVTEYELKAFAKLHPSLRTIAAICTPCNQTTISGINILNASSLSECLEFLVLTDRIDMASDFMKEVFQKVKTSGNLEIADLRHVRRSLQFVLRKSNNEKNKFWSVLWYLESGLFENELSKQSFSMDIFESMKLLYNAYNFNELAEYHELAEYQEQYAGLIFRMLEFLANYVTPGVMTPHRVLNFVIEKILYLVGAYPQYKYEGNRIVSEAEKRIGRDQLQKIIGKSKLWRKVQMLLNLA
ncbi:unnamed protein product [Caenorhabditis nigoni]